MKGGPDNANRYWDREYGRLGHVWGDKPGELAQIAVARLRGRPAPPRRILDIGCGYGRDAVHLLQTIGCPVTGIDNSREAIDAAGRFAADSGAHRLLLRCCGFADLAPYERYDVVFAANLYHLLPAGDRALLREKIDQILAPGGLLFLITLSANDREEFGKGSPVAGEQLSFQGERFFHFATREELAADFAFVGRLEIYEHSYIEHRPDRNHHHTAWILLGERC